MCYNLLIDGLWYVDYLSLINLQKGNCMKYFRCRDNGKLKKLECERDLLKENCSDKKDEKRLQRLEYKIGYLEKKEDIRKERANKQTVIVDQSQKMTKVELNKSKTTKTDINVQDVKVLSDNQKTTTSTSKQPSEKKPTNTKKPQTKKKPTKPKK